MYCCCSSGQSTTTELNSVTQLLMCRVCIWGCTLCARSQPLFLSCYLTRSPQRKKLSSRPGGTAGWLLNLRPGNLDYEPAQPPNKSASKPTARAPFHRRPSSPFFRARAVRAMRSARHGVYRHGRLLPCFRAAHERVHTRQLG